MTLLFFGKWHMLMLSLKAIHHQCQSPASLTTQAAATWLQSIQPGQVPAQWKPQVLQGGHPAPFPREDLAVPCRLFTRPEEADGVGLEQDPEWNYSHCLQHLQFICLHMRTERTRPQGTSWEMILCNSLDSCLLCCEIVHVLD